VDPSRLEPDPQDSWKAKGPGKASRKSSNCRELWRRARAVADPQRYSNYLTPRVGATDTLAGVATYVRNLILNQAILIAFACAILLLPLASLQWGGAALRPAWLAALALLLLAVATLCIYSSLAAPIAQKPSPLLRQLRVVVLVVIPLIAAAALGAFWLRAVDHPFGALPVLGPDRRAVSRCCGSRLARADVRAKADSRDPTRRSNGACRSSVDGWRFASRSWVPASSTLCCICPSPGSPLAHARARCAVALDRLRWRV
jgi:hypothetical protein